MGTLRRGPGLDRGLAAVYWAIRLLAEQSI
jgi:hypothetical protein